MTSRNLTVDILRLAAALEVIFLHMEFQGMPSLLPVAIRLQARWAVPFFFILSGYYLARRLDNPDQREAHSAIQRMVWVFGLWTLIYIPLVLYQHDLREVFRRLLLPEFLYSGTYFHLWFPSSLVLGLLVLLTGLHYKLERLAPWISILILAHILLAGSYDIFGIKFPFDFDTARHWLSVPCLFIGVWLFRRGPLSRVVSFSLLAGGLVLQAVEAYLLLTRFGVSAYNHEVLIGTLPAALGAASLGLSGLRWLEQPTLAGWGKEYALGIYLLHPMMTYILLIPVSRLAAPLAGYPALQLTLPFAVLLACIGFFALIRRWAPAAFGWLTGRLPDQTHT